MKWLVPVAAGAVFVLSLCLCLWTTVSASEPFECYVCNSFQDPDGCTYTNVDRKYLKNCTEFPHGASFNQCRIIRQWVDFDVLGMKANERVIRMCGVQHTERVCYYRAGFGGRQEVCTCNKPRCNHAPRMVTSQPIIMVLAFVAAIIGVQRIVVQVAVAAALRAEELCAFCIASMGDGVTTALHLLHSGKSGPANANILSPTRFGRFRLGSDRPEIPPYPGVVKSVKSASPPQPDETLSSRSEISNENFLKNKIPKSRSPFILETAVTSLT